MATKVMVSFPDEFLAEVDRVAQEEHRSRSELVREALRFYISLRQEPGQPGAAPFGRQAVMARSGDQVSPVVPGSDLDRTTDIQPMRAAPSPQAQEGAALDVLNPDREGYLLERLVAWAQSQPEILALYLYGSQAEGHASALSDVDVAVWAQEDLSRQHLWEMESRWGSRWSGAVDLRVLNLAPLPFRYEVTAHGRRLWAADAGQVADLESRTWRLYWDQKPRLERDWQAHVRQALEERDEAERRAYETALARVRAVHRRVREAAAGHAPDLSG